jgi:hypothetical protein
MILEDEPNHGERNNDWERLEREIRGELTIAEICLEARVGSYIDVKKLEAIDFTQRIKPKWQWLAELMRRAYKRDITLRNNHALAHLGLTISDFAVFDDLGVLTIEKLGKVIEAGELRIGFDPDMPDLYELGNTDEQRIIKLYQDWLTLPGK